MDVADDHVAARERWLGLAHLRYGNRLREGLHLSTHGLLLQHDLERSFIAGAWASVIVMAQAVIEATMRQVQLQGYEIKAKSLFKGVKRLERIRSLRNELVHPAPPGTPSLVWRAPGRDLAACHALLESDAKRAVEYMLYVVYTGQWADGRGDEV